MFAILFMILTGAAQASTWNATLPSWALKAYGPKSPEGDTEVVSLDSCPINPSWTTSSTWGCQASDAGQTIAAVNASTGASWLRPDGQPFAVCKTDRYTNSGITDGYDSIFVSLEFASGRDGNGFATWPSDSSWPTSVKCVKTMASGQTHAYTVPIGNAPATTRVILPVSTSVISLTSGSAVAVPAVWDDAGRRFFNLPNGTYTGGIISGAVSAKNAAGSANYDWVTCAMASMADDWLMVAANENSANGTAYCPLSYNGTAMLVPFTITTP